jgi:hypothetical protein
MDLHINSERIPNLPIDGTCCVIEGSVIVGVKGILLIEDRPNYYYEIFWEATANKNILLGSLAVEMSKKLFYGLVVLYVIKNLHYVLMKMICESPRVSN